MLSIARQNMRDMSITLRSPAQNFVHERHTMISSFHQLVLHRRKRLACDVIDGQEERCDADTYKTRIAEELIQKVCSDHQFQRCVNQGEGPSRRAGQICQRRIVIVSEQSHSATLSQSTEKRFSTCAFRAKFTFSTSSESSELLSELALSLAF